MNLPTDLSGDQLRKALERVGFVLQRQRGSHMILRRAEPSVRVVVPAHRRIRPGTLRQNPHAAGLSVEDLKSLL